MKLMTAQQPSKKFNFIGILLLTVMLFASVSHSHEFSLEQFHVVEQVDCKLCQIQLDLPKQQANLAQISLVSFSAYTPQLPERYPHKDVYPHSAPRAPPHLIF